MCCRQGSGLTTTLSQNPGALKQLIDALVLKYKTAAITDIKSLESTLFGLAKALFNETHGYTWDGNNSTPADLGSNGHLKALSSFADIKAADASNSLEDILGNGKAPEWLRTKAELDIGTQAIKIFHDAKNGQWNEATFNASYENPTPDQGPIEARIAFLYANATLVDNGETGTHTILYYLATYHGPKGSGI